MTIIMLLGVWVSEERWLSRRRLVRRDSRLNKSSPETICTMMTNMYSRSVCLVALPVLAFLVSPLTAASPNSLSARERAEGFELLFDGETTHGWFLLRPADADGKWIVEDGCLVPRDRPRELASNKTFDDFELRFEWKIAPGGNSGVMYRVEKGYHAPTTGPEYQLLDDERHKVGSIPDRKTAAAYGIYPPEKDATKPAGEWNTARIIVRGDHVEHWLNGVKVLAYEMHSHDWKTRVAKSKFAKHPQYGRARSGHIVLQDHGSGVWFRGIRFRKLEPES